MNTRKNDANEALWFFIISSDCVLCFNIPEVKLAVSSQVNYTLQAFWAVSIRELHMSLWRPWIELREQTRTTAIVDSTHCQHSALNMRWDWWILFIHYLLNLINFYIHIWIEITVTSGCNYNYEFLLFSWLFTFLLIGILDIFTVVSRVRENYKAENNWTFWVRKK